jgi:hypothetical protein
VTLTVSDGTNSDSETKVDYITVTDPNQVTDTVFVDLFESGLGLWTIINNGGTCDWEIFTPPYPNTYTLPATSSGGVLVADSDVCGSGTTMNTTAEVTQVLDLSNYDVVTIEFDNDWNVLDAADEAHVEVSNDGGSTWVGVWDQIGTDITNTHESINISSIAANQSNVKVRVRSVQPGWDWWWAVDNFAVFGTYIIPVELTSFNAEIIDSKVFLNWETATETNNMGFEIERKSGAADFVKIGFVEGHSTTTEKQNYQFIDVMNEVQANSFTYRLKQIDYDGSYEYSDEVFVDNTAPVDYALQQNYPNPFNPATTISYSLPLKSQVELVIYNTLGESVMRLVNEEKEAGKYSVKFDATNLPSGIYFYKLQAGSFIETKKMVLMK